MLTGYQVTAVTFNIVLGGYMMIVAYAAIYLIWGSTYLAIRIAVGAIPPLLLMGVRCTAAGLLLLAWSAARRERATAAHWRHAAVAGALMIGVTYGALAWAEQRLTSGIAALLSATSPLWLTTMQWRHVGRPGARTIFGLLLGLAGVAVLVGAGTVGDVNPKAAAVLIVGTVAWAAGSLYARPPRLPRPATLGAGMPLLVGGLMLLGDSIATRAWARDAVRAGSRRGVTEAQAAWRPGPGLHNIRELTVHAAYWKYAVRRRLLGTTRGSFALPGSNWFEIPENRSWKDDLQLLGDEHRQLRAAVSAYP